MKITTLVGFGAPNCTPDRSFMEVVALTQTFLSIFSGSMVCPHVFYSAPSLPQRSLTMK